MYNTSNEFKEAIYSPTRTVKGRVTFDISDVTAVGDMLSITSTEESIISDVQQSSNLIRDFGYNLATFETNRFKLDGSFSFPDDVIVDNGEMGFVSNNLSNYNGEFILQPTLTFIFNTTHSSAGITLSFDTNNNEYATEFTINAYDGSNNLILSNEVIGNTSNQIAVIGQFFLYEKVEVIIKKWSKPFRRARVVEVSFGVVKIYKDENLISIKLQEDMDITSFNIPTSELNFSIENSNREFNILNPDGFHKFLQERQMVTSEIGVLVGSKVEYVKLGNFYLVDWVSEEGSLISSFTANNILDLMSNYDYENLSPKTGYNLYQMLEEIFLICEVTDYQIDIALQSITTKGLVKKNNCRNILQMIAVAGMSNVYIDRNGKLIIKPIILGTEVGTIDMDNMYMEPQIKLDKIVKNVEVKYYSDISTNLTTLVSNADEGEVLKVDNTLINTITHANDVANWVLNQRNYRAMYSASWRGDPSQELSDIMIIEDNYNVNNKSIVTNIDINYEGYLKGNIKSRGLVE